MIPAARKKRYNSGAGRGWWKAARLSAAKRDWSFRIVSVKSAVIAALAAFGLSAPSAAWAALSPDATVVAQTRPPVEISSYPSGDASRPATLGHIRWLAERSDRQWEENQRRWDENQRRWEENQSQLNQIRGELREIRDEVAGLKTTAILVMGMIITALLGIIAIQLPRREKAPVRENPAGHHPRTV